MKTKMLISIAIVLFCLFGTVTCRSLEDRAGEAGMTALLEQTEQLGVLHNQLLDSAINAIMLERVRAFKESGGIEQMTRAGGDEVAGRYASVILNTLKRASRNLGVPINDETEEQYFSRGKFIALSTRAASLDSELELTPFQQKYYDRLMEIISAEGNSPDEVLYNIAELEKQIAAEAPTAEEAQVLFYGTVTARHSYAYWQKNMDTWRTVLNGQIIAVGNIEDFEREMILAESATRAVDDPPYTQVPPGTFIPFPGDPRYFFRVEDDGRVVLFQCPQGLIFNPATCTCEFPTSDNSSFWEMVGCDVIGALLGGFVEGTTGAAAGSVVGPAGTAGGAIAGALKGALEGAFVTSTAVGLQGLWDWLF